MVFPEVGIGKPEVGGRACGGTFPGEALAGRGNRRMAVLKESTLRG